MKKAKMHRLSADERPMFGPYNAVQATAKDKAKTRRAQKLALKKLRDSFYDL